MLVKTDGQLQTITELVSRPGSPDRSIPSLCADCGIGDCVCTKQKLSTIEFSQLQNQVLLSLQNGSQVLGELQKEMSLERAESIVDRVGEGVAAQRVSRGSSLSYLMQRREGKADWWSVDMVYCRRSTRL